MSMAYSIFQKDMNTSRFLILALAADLMWICILSPIILKRTITTNHWIAFALALIGYILYDMIVYEG